jgi:hypothetical protein
MFEWSGSSGIYPYELAKRTYTVYAAARRFEDSPVNKNELRWVLRWIPESQVPRGGDEHGTAEKLHEAGKGTGA